MIFHSLDFAAFFLIVVTVYWRLPRRAQNLWLVAASYVFYGYVHPWFVTLVFATTVADYWAGRGMADWPEKRRLFLGLSLAANLGMLGFFKYFNFFAENVHAALTLAGLDVPRTTLAVVLPVGVSFYTFQELSYTIDVYRGTLTARRSFFDFAAFVCFFPQLVAGPIERASRLLPQVEQPRVFSWVAAREATVLMVWGYFKKLVIADNVGIIANKVFGLKDPSFEVLWAGVFAFGIQIYADFSAYSDIARGTARWFGFDLMRNFHHPYFARGPVDFWRRWHISLSSWFRDYVYIPLGGSRRGRWFTARNVLVTFLLSGLWHGASWNYVLWGLYHGVLLVAARLFGRWPVTSTLMLRVLTPLRIVGMFVLVEVGWLMFRETDIRFLLHDLTLSPWASTTLQRQTGIYLLLTAAAYSLPLWVHGAWEELRTAPARTVKAPPQRWGWVAAQAVLCGVLLATLLVFRSRTSLDFIYFQF
ncbi:MAG: MBOAT family protein [Vicinamibacterales bacterium]